MLDWLGDEGVRLHKAFVGVFGDRCRPFGNRSTHIGGLSDGNEGVQWNAGYDPQSRSRWLGVNLEGKKYDGWPVARLILRELESPTLPTLVDQVGHLGRVELHWARDYWQATARPEIAERDIAPTPLLLAELTQARWRSALVGARGCLDPDKGWRGRATQEVTLTASGRTVAGPVSPHLTFYLRSSGSSSWSTYFAESRATMEPLYQWATERAA